MTGEAGWLAFNTIYPGWYDGRTPHIHLKDRLAALVPGLTSGR